MQDKKKPSHVGYVINLQNVLISILLNEFGVSYSLVNSIEFGFKSNLKTVLLLLKYSAN